MRTAAVLLALVAAPLPLRAQAQQPGTQQPGGQRCRFQIDNVDRQGSVVETPTGTNYFAGGNVRLSCRGTRISMRSDSVAAYAGNVVQFIGNVQYRDSSIAMDADFGTYYRDGEKWEARGKVVTQNLTTGSKLTGPTLDYYREVAGVRDTFEMYATRRPRIEYATTDSAGRKAEPYIIVADRVRFKGNDRIWAGGKVTIDRSDFSARGDSLRLDTGKGSDGTLVGGEPVLRGVGADSFTLSGKRIDLRLDRRELTYVVAKGGARAVNREWDLVADTIALDVNDRKLEQTFAWGKTTRPFANSASYAMRADSLAMDTPGQQVREVRGFGKAWLGGDVDSLSKERNWMRGDTVVANFAQYDSAGTTRTRLARIEARREAQSYHVDPSVRYPGRPGINYARGDVIVVTMRQGEQRGVDRVDVQGKVDGIQLEPTAPAAPDTLQQARGSR